MEERKQERKQERKKARKKERREKKEERKKERQTDRQKKRNKQTNDLMRATISADPVALILGLLVAPSQRCAHAFFRGIGR